MRATFTTPHFRPIIDRHNRIPANVKKGIRAGVKKVVDGVSKQAKTYLTRERTGLLKKALGSKVATNASTERTTGLVGARKGFSVTITEIEAKTTAKKQTLKITATNKKGKKVKLKGFDKQHLLLGKKLSASSYLHLVERGHKRGKGRSSAKPYPFLKPAGAHGNQEAGKILVEEINTATRAT